MRFVTFFAFVLSATSLSFSASLRILGRGGKRGLRNFVSLNSSSNYTVINNHIQAAYKHHLEKIGDFISTTSKIGNSMYLFLKFLKKRCIIHYFCKNFRKLFQDSPIGGHLYYKNKAYLPYRFPIETFDSYLDLSPQPNTLWL